MHPAKTRLVGYVPVLALLVALTAVSARTAEHHIRIDTSSTGASVYVDGALFTALRSGDDAHKMYLHPLMSAAGRQVTRSFPMDTVAGDSTDHPHQRGVWIGTEDLSGIDFWENEASYDRPNKGLVTLSAIRDVKSGAGEGQFTLDANWTGPHGEPTIAETRTMIFRAARDQRLIDIDLRLVAKTAVTFADNHDALLGLRLGTAFEEAHGGVAVNAEGARGWKDLRGAKSAWVDWMATVGGATVGVAVMDHPSNFRFPTRWHVRDYALLFAAPFASRDYSASNPDGSLTLAPGGDLRVRYRILVHDGTADIASSFSSFADWK